MSFSAFCSTCGRYYTPMMLSEGKEICRPCFHNKIINNNFKNTPHAPPYDTGNTIRHSSK